MIIFDREGSGEHKENVILPRAAAKVEGELGADDCCNSMPEENHAFHKAQSLTAGDGRNSVRAGRAN